MAGPLRGGALAAGLVAGLLAAGAGGRLVMRLLALTSPEAEGSFTEAAEVVGEITFGGTLGFILFVGVPAGLLSGALYALLRPALPRGRAGGVVLGGLLLVLAGTRIEPLRSDNIDFSLVGPAWLAVLGFAAVALLQGMLVVALSTRFAVPEPSSARISDVALTAGRIAVGGTPARGAARLHRRGRRHFELRLVPQPVPERVQGRPGVARRRDVHGQPAARVHLAEQRLRQFSRYPVTPPRQDIGGANRGLPRRAWVRRAARSSS